MIILDIPANLIAATNSITSVPQALAYSFLLPSFSLILVLIAFGILWIRTRRIELGALGAFITSLVMYYISPNLITQQIVTTLALLLVLLALVALFLGKKNRL